MAHATRRRGLCRDIEAVVAYHSAVAFESIIQSMHIVSVQRLEFSRFIFFVVFYIDEEKLAANPGAMAIPDRSYRCFARPSPKADTFRRRADAVPPLIWQTTTRARVFVLPGGVGA